MIIFAERLSAQDAFVGGFVAKVIPDEKFREETEKLVKKYSNLSVSVSFHSLYILYIILKSVILSKLMMRRENVKQQLKEVTDYEAERVKEQITSEETIERLMNKFMKSKV